MPDPSPSRPLKDSVEKLADHEGILGVNADPEHSQVTIDYDPGQVSEDELRDLASGLAPAMERRSFRLEGDACEAVAIRLEKKVERIPGVRRATATYIGKVLCLTFDSNVTGDAALSEGLEKAGAAVKPLEFPAKAKAHPGFRERLFSGEWNDGISCALGFVFLVSAWSVVKFLGAGTAGNVLYTLAYVFAGQQGVRSAIASLRERVLDVDVLMVLAALGAALIGAPFEGALLLFLFSFSNVLQRRAMDRTQRAIESLLTLRPEEATVKSNGGTRRVAVGELQIGDIVMLRPGELVPVDGVVMEGNSHLDESSLTGESMPVAKSPGSTVFAGTINQSGGIEFRVSKLAGDSTLARMVKLVAEAQAEKSRTQRFLEQAEQYYAMGVIGFTILVFLVPWLLMGQSFAEAFYRAMTLMVVASPCALIISTPATVLSAIGGAARKGILIKGGSHLERAARIDIVAIDKTGTLTVGKPALTGIVTARGMSPAQGPLDPESAAQLAVAAALESKSEHPLAAAIVRRTVELGVSFPEAIGFQSTAGKGAEAMVAGVRHVIGSERMFRENGAEGMDVLSAAAAPLQADGQTCVWLGDRATDGTLTARAVFSLADTLRPEARTLVADLRHLGVRKVIMLTGDQRLVAAAIGRDAGVDEIRAELLPADKLSVIRDLKREGGVMMVGDGVNDAPALAASDLGVAMGAAGTDVAMETADVVLMGDRLENIALLLSHAKRARRVLIQNLVFASSVIVVLVAVTLGFSLPLPIGVIGHEGSTVLVCLNGLRLLMLRGK